ncbi:PaaI family thioesterase [Frankia sp. AgKG'84/4]|uniref:PaaI family thioesterase n=1 Tax=Frankia sp. AgKG'84/4 TaxID=573490 RepID=UPI00200CA1A7|nr:hotdog domain-containing protein [Frankia sp. AgKG'84/4]MCL9793508.1 PaaI family thioesterase [Frankia sp. AgKG'84/4]
METEEISGTEPRSSPIADLGITVREQGSEMHGTLPAVPRLAVPGTSWLRASALATLADIQLGLLVVREIAPRIPVTLSLEVHLFEEIAVGGTIHGVGRVVKAGRSVLALAVEFHDEADRPVGSGHCLFMASPDPSLRIPTGRWALDRLSTVEGSLSVPVAQRFGCQRLEPGVASLPCTSEVRNSARTLNGGLIPLVVEEAVLSMTPGATLASLSLEYLRPVRQGPALARARLRGDVGTVEVHDAGSDVLAVIATTRAFPGRPGS